MALILLLDPVNASTLSELVVSLASAAPLLYVGPDQLMPLASAFSAIVGVALMFWRKLVALAVRVWGLVSRRERPLPDESSVRDRA